MIKYAFAFILLSPLFTIAQEKPTQEKTEEINWEEVEVEEEESEDGIIFSAEVMPEFPGGPEAMFKFIVSELVYPPAALDTGIQGKVFVRFTVMKTGKIENVLVMRGIGGGCDEESVRVVDKMPLWSPGTQRGKPVNVQYTLPINFVMRADSKKKKK